MNAYDIILRPVITEQSMADVADKKYVFQVAIDANKTEIKAAVEEIFGVRFPRSTPSVCRARSSAPVLIPPAAAPPTRRLSSP